MKRFCIAIATLLIIAAVCFSGDSGKTEATTSASGTMDVDTLVVHARLIEIPGTFPPNDLYNYVYIMKYRVLKVVKGDFKGKEILVGQYNPLIPRQSIDDKMDAYVDGTADAFEQGVNHTLTLAQPLDAFWKEAIEDEYFDIDDTRWYALKTDTMKK